MCSGLLWYVFFNFCNNFIIISKKKKLVLKGKRCEYLTSSTFIHNTSYVELEPLVTKPEANVTIIFATTQENGVLLYDGNVEHLAVELFNGRIRVSYDVGNYPVSTMYRYLYCTRIKILAFLIFLF